MRDPDDLSFEGATAVGATADPGLFEAHVHEHWTVGDKPNGGYLLALLGRAARLTGRTGGGPDWEVVSSAITYLRPPEPGPATVRTTLLRQGRSASTCVPSWHRTTAISSTPCSCSVSCEPNRRHRYDGTAPLHVPPVDECVRLAPRIPDGRLRGDHGRARPQAQSGHAPLHRFTPA